MLLSRSSTAAPGLMPQRRGERKAESAFFADSPGSPEDLAGSAFSEDAPPSQDPPPQSPERGSLAARSPSRTGSWPFYCGALSSPRWFAMCYLAATQRAAGSRMAAALRKKTTGQGNPGRHYARPASQIGQRRRFAPLALALKLLVMPLAACHQHFDSALFSQPQAPRAPPRAR